MLSVRNRNFEHGRDIAVVKVIGLDFHPHIRRSLFFSGTLVTGKNVFIGDENENDS